MFFKAIPAVLLLVYYGLCTWNGMTLLSVICTQLALSLQGVFVWGQISYAKKHNIFDEFAKENLKNYGFYLLEVSLCVDGYCGVSLRIR